MILSNAIGLAVRNGISHVFKNRAKTATTISVITAIFGTAETIKATVRTVRRIDEAIDDKGDDLTLEEKLKIILPEYGKAAVLTGVSIGSTVMSYKENTKIINNLAGIAAATAAEYRDYRRQTKLLTSDETEREIMNAVVKDRQEHIQPYINPNQTIVIDETSRTWFYEPISGRKFESTINRVEKGLNDFNMNMFASMEMDKPLNDLLDNWDQEPLYETGDELQFSIDSGGAELKKPYESIILDGKSYILLNFENPPRY